MWGLTDGPGREVGSVGDVADGLGLGRVIGPRDVVGGLRRASLAGGLPSRRAMCGVVTVTGATGRALGVGDSERRVMGEREERLTPRRSDC